MLKSSELAHPGGSLSISGACIGARGGGGGRQAKDACDATRLTDRLWTGRGAASLARSLGSYLGGALPVSRGETVPDQAWEA